MMNLGPHISTLLGSAPLAEGESAPEPIPEGETTRAPSSEVEPNSTAQVEPEPEAETWPEPGPMWSEAFKTWKSAWTIHVYLFATVYLLMAFYSAYFVIFNVYDGLDKKYLSVSLNIMVLVFCLSRSFIMYLDPYHQGDIIHALKVMHLLWSIGGPCLTAADSLIILALLEMCHLRITIPSLQKASVITVIITIHFFFVIVTDFVVAEYVSAKGMIVFCQAFYMVWGFVLGTGYIRLGYVLDKQLFGHKPKKDKEDKFYTFLIYASGIANYGLVVIMLYTAVGVFGVYSNVKFVDAWHWWILQTLFRFSEVITCVLIFTVSAKRSRVKQAMDDISAIGTQLDSESPTIRPTPLQKLRKILGLKRAKKVEVKPFKSTEDIILTDPKPAPRGRRMSMFSDMENTSKFVMKIKNAQKAQKNLALERLKEADQTGGIFSGDNDLISTFDDNDILEVISNRDNGDTNDNNLKELQIHTKEKESNTKPNVRRNIYVRRHLNGFFKTSQKHLKSHRNDTQVAGHSNINEECEEDKSSTRPTVRKISAQVLRRLSQPFVKVSVHKGKDDEVILQDELQGNRDLNGPRDNVGFQSDDKDIHSIPNVPI
jgi:hypothetical protein